MGILDRIKKAHETKQTLMKALIHGNSGSGKSTLAHCIGQLYKYTGWRARKCPLFQSDHKHTVKFRPLRCMDGH